MIAASRPVQRPADAKLLVVDEDGSVSHRSRGGFPQLLHAGDVVIANDAATLPASLFGEHVPSQRSIEVRLAVRRSLDPDDVRQFGAIVFGEGDYRTRTEDRPQPPPLRPGDRIHLGPLRATVARLLGHPRFVALRFDGSPHEIWEGLSRHGRPIQYAHVPTSLAVWDTWTPVAGPPVAFEPPSAGFVLDWSVLAELRARGIRFGTITHAAGISSTGDPLLDARLPFDEPYRIPRSVAEMIARAHARGSRVIAIGTTVVRALEHATGRDGIVHPGEGVATQKIGPSTQLHVVNSILSGTHERGTSHFELLRAFACDESLLRMDNELEARGYRTHEFGDSVFLTQYREASRRAAVA